MTDEQEPVERTFVGLPSPVVGRAGAGGHPCQGLYHSPLGRRPDDGASSPPTTTSTSPSTTWPSYMAARGYGFLGWNTRFRGAEPYFLLDHALVEIAVGVRWLREQGVERVVLLGNSGGGSLMSAYHSQCQGVTIRPARGGQLLPAARRPRAGRPVRVPRRPSRPARGPHRLARSERCSTRIDPTSAATRRWTCTTRPTGRRTTRRSSPGTGPPSGPATIGSPTGAQIARLEELAGMASATSCSSCAGRGPTPGSSIRPSTRRRGATPRCYAGDPQRANNGVFGIGTVSTLRTWLNMWSLRESDCRGGPHLRPPRPADPADPARCRQRRVPVSGRRRSSTPSPLADKRDGRRCPGATTSRTRPTHRGRRRRHDRRLARGSRVLTGLTSSAAARGCAEARPHYDSSSWRSPPQTSNVGHGSDDGRTRVSRGCRTGCTPTPTCTSASRSGSSAGRRGATSR